MPTRPLGSQEPSQSGVIRCFCHDLQTNAINVIGWVMKEAKDPVITPKMIPLGYSKAIG